MSAFAKRWGAAGTAGALFSAISTATVRAADLLGQPTPGGIGLQPAASPLRHSAIFFHDWVLLPIIIAISVFVLALLAWVVFKFNAKANPEPARFTHNTAIEIVWTAAPVLILMFIAIFSFRLLFTYHDMPKPDVTVKVTGNQWYWNYEYPQHGGFAFDSIPLTEDKMKAAGHPELWKLAVDNPMVVPVGKTVQVLSTSADVLHAFFVPAFGVQQTTIPGRINQTWFKAEREGIYYGECNELCGVNHSFMPIQVDVVSQAKYDAWVAAHAPKTPQPVASPVPAAAPGQSAPAAPAAAVPDATVGPNGAAPPSPAPAGAATAAQTGPLGKAKTSPAAEAAKPMATNAASPSR